MRDKPSVGHSELRDVLIDTIEQVKAGKITPDKARAIAELAKGVIQVDRLQFDFARLIRPRRRRAINGDVQKPLALENKSPTIAKKETARKGDEIPVSNKPASNKLQSMSRDQAIEQIAKLLKREQPMKLQEIAAATGFPQADLFGLLNCDRFEKDISGYWLANEM